MLRLWVIWGGWVETNLKWRPLETEAVRVILGSWDQPQLKTIWGWWFEQVESLRAHVAACPILPDICKFLISSSYHVSSSFRQITFSIVVFLVNFTPGSISLYTVQLQYIRINLFGLISGTKSLHRVVASHPTAQFSKKLAMLGDAIVVIADWPTH